MINIEDYMKLTQQERQAHLRLDEDCIERGGKSEHYRGLLAHVLNTTMPTGSKVQLCHACHNPVCGNANHLYWGTPRENKLDAIANGAPINPYYAVMAKQGDAARQSQARPGNRNGEGNAGSNKTTDHKSKISEAMKRVWAERKKR